jgi:hypothetical protein
MPSILELFHSSGLKESVKADTETLVEQETSGIRIKSLVELNNPLIYGNEATRIANRSTSDVEEMTTSNGGSGTDGGLIGKGLSKLGIDGGISGLRDKVNSKLGIPTNAIPTRLLGKEGFTDLKSTDPVTLDTYGDNGTEIGKFLKQTGGGNPKTIGKQALGKGIGVAKDVLRGALFGEGAEEATNGANLEYAVEFTDNTNKYTEVKKTQRLVSPDGAQKDLEKNSKLGGVKLQSVSPIYGLKRKEEDRRGWLQGREYGMNSLENSRYSPAEPKRSIVKDVDKDGNPTNYFAETKMESEYRLTNGDGLNTISPADDFTMEDNAFMKVGEEVYRDFVPLWFKKIGATKPLVFRAIISGLTETSTPSWSGNKFIGNPYSFYTYSGVERSVSFNIKLMASSPIELNVIWERLKVLTSYTYPTIYKGLSNPPIIEFRLGSMYVDRVAYVDSLTYTIPDESNWETDGNIGYLPKTIDVALSMKFIESGGAEDRLYDMDISKAAAKTINDARKDEVDAINEEAKTRGGKAVAVPQKVTEKKQSSVTVLKGKGSSAFGKAKDVLKSLKGKADDVTTTPADKEASIPDPKAGQSSIVEKLDGKTPIEAIKENESKFNITKTQSAKLASLKLMWREAKIIKTSDLNSEELASYTHWVDKRNLSNVMIVKCSSPGESPAGNIIAFDSDGMKLTLSVQ